jgi:competence protein ComEC
MRLHDIFFWAACFFLAGVLIAGIASGFEQAILITASSTLLVLSILFILSTRTPSALSHGKAALGLFMFLGAAYFFLHDHIQKDSEIIFDRKVEFTGVVTEAEQRINSQKLILDNIQITTGRYPQYEYGDRLKITGIIKKPEGEFANYFAKEGIAGLMSFPKIEVLSHAKVPSIKGTLFKIKSFFETSYKRVLPFDQAAFLSGLTLGSTAEFSDEFEEKMRLTGTTHLVALSGYNISIIIRYVGGMFAIWWLTRKLKLALSILVVVGFVVMTGAEPSVVRAAIMAMILLFADQIGREAHVPNVIAAVALVMVLVNPKILAFDVGFQLSFMALIGIIYLEPWLRKKLKAKEEPGILGWRKHFWGTTSAQLAVLPIIVYHFGFVSPVSILTNVFLLEFIPFTMFLGFFIGFASVISYWLSWIIALPTQVFLGYELKIIDSFSKFIGMF